MDTSLMTSETGLMAWVSMYGNVIYFFAQITFWAGMLLLAAYAVAQYKRWVNYQLGTGRSGALRKAEEADGASVPQEDSTVSVDAFVD